MGGHAGICGACQKDIIKQISPGLIKCPSCTTTWSNKFLKSGKTPDKSIQGLPCPSCGKGMLMQTYWNEIHCNNCTVTWRSWKNKFYNGRAQLRSELAKIG